MFSSNLILLVFTSAALAASSQKPDTYNQHFNINQQIRNIINHTSFRNPSIYSYTTGNQYPPSINISQQSIENEDNFSYQNAYNKDISNNFNLMNPVKVNRNFYFTNDVAENQELKVNLRDTQTQPAPVSGCSLSGLAVYKAVLHTYWTRDLFPKHYPDWRPTAQWTRTVGRTHNHDFYLYHLGQQASDGVKQFAETGKVDILDSSFDELKQKQQILGNPIKTNLSSVRRQQQQQTKNRTERSVLDEFNLPPIQSGGGRSESTFFVDSNHSLVSLMTRIVPSPDWFIGVDTFELCVGGSWIDTVTVEADPLDAGTDNGFTFTAPNWPTSPQGVIYRITSQYPAHPASSFFYPKNKRLPPIATYQFIKLKEYELSEVFHFVEDDRKYETVKTQTHLESEHNHIEMNNELSASIERERESEIAPMPTYATKHDRVRSRLLAKMKPRYDNNDTADNIVSKNDKHALLQNIAKSYKRTVVSPSTPESTLPKNFSKRRRLRRQRDCRVSHWSDWTPCSKTCSIGEMHRYRKVIKHGKRGGRPCPALQESKWCGTERGCETHATYFNWSDT